MTGTVVEKLTKSGVPYLYICIRYKYGLSQSRKQKRISTGLSAKRNKKRELETSTYEGYLYRISHIREYFEPRKLKVCDIPGKDMDQISSEAAKLFPFEIL